MIYPFDSIPLPTLAEVGGKGLSLMKVTHADLPMPPEFVCTGYNWWKAKEFLKE